MSRSDTLFHPSDHSDLSSSLFLVEERLKTIKKDVSQGTELADPNMTQLAHRIILFMSGEGTYRLPLFSRCVIVLDNIMVLRQEILSKISLS